MPVLRNAEETARNLSQKFITKSAGLSSDVVRKSLCGSMLLDFLLPPATKLGQGNIFRSVCQEFCPHGGGAW